ncbi:hypothetical protein Bca4012_095357 [Brassica carinata]
MVEVIKGWSHCGEKLKLGRHTLDLVIAPLQRVASPAVSLFLWLFGEKIKQRMCAAVGFLGLDLDRFILRSSPIRLLVRRRFGLPLLRLRWVSASGLGCHLAKGWCFSVLIGVVGRWFSFP